jgi:hypothetical protein
MDNDAACVLLRQFVDVFEDVFEDDQAVFARTIADFP